MRIPFSALLLPLIALPAMAQQADVATRVYDCERGAVVHAAYLNTGEDAYAVIAVDGRQLAMEIREAASGARYVTTGDQPYHVWWTKGEEASLYAGPDETMVLGDCKARPVPSGD